MNTDNQQQGTSLLADLGLDGLPENEKNEMVIKLAESLQNRVTIRLTEALSDEQKTELDKLIAQGADDKAIGEYLVKSIPDMDKITKDEYDAFREELMSENKTLQGRVKKIINDGSGASSS